MLNYEYLDSGDGKKLEKWGPYKLIRPATHALWKPGSPELWKKADATFTRERGWHPKLKAWTVTLEGVKLLCQPTDFGHLGIFPEHSLFWPWIQTQIDKECSVLNLFAYSGGATLAAAQVGAQVCHVDASKAVVAWARENCALNGLEKAPIRWIAEDAIKFMKREVKRGRQYEGIILDPPTFGRGAKGEVFKLEEDIETLVSLCRELLNPNRGFLLFTCHTPGINSTALANITHSYFTEGQVESGEMELKNSQSPYALPSGAYVKWSR